MRKNFIMIAVGIILLAAGWWMQRPQPVDVTGTYVTTGNEVDRRAACSGAEDVTPGSLRVTPTEVQFSDQTCTIASRETVMIPMAGDGPFEMEVLGLTCGGPGAGPGGMDAELTVSGRGELTTFIADGSDDPGYIPAHSALLSCESLPTDG